MSRLPEGTAATRAFLETVAINGAMAEAVAFMPFLGLPIIKQILEKVFLQVIIDKGFDEAVAFALAVSFVEDRESFDKAFIALRILEKSGASRDQLEVALEVAEKSMAKFIRRGPVT